MRLNPIRYSLSHRNFPDNFQNWPKKKKKIIFFFKKMHSSIQKTLRLAQAQLNSFSCSHSQFSLTSWIVFFFFFQE
ncbi:hypothetical protein ACOSQ4_024813 [Xanthoceras sorbifolium]